MLKKGKVWGRKLVAGIMMAAIVLGNTAVATEASTKDAGKTVAVVQEDNYRKTLCKDFLGKSYGSVIDGIRCDCSGYTRAALNRLESKGKTGTALKNVQVGTTSSRDWVSGSTITYTTGVLEDDEITWAKQTTLSIGKKSSGASDLSDLELGDVVGVVVFFINDDECELVKGQKKSRTRPSHKQNIPICKALQGFLLLGFADFGVPHYEFVLKIKAQTPLHLR